MMMRNILVAVGNNYSKVESLDIHNVIEYMKQMIQKARAWFQDCGFHIVQGEYRVHPIVPEAICACTEQNRIDQIPTDSSLVASYQRT